MIGISMAKVADFLGVTYSRLRNWKNDGLWDGLKPFELEDEWISLDTIKVAAAAFMLAMKKRKVRSEYALDRIKATFEVLERKAEDKRRLKGVGKDIELYLLVVRHPVESRVLIISPSRPGQFQLIDDEDTLIIEVTSFLKDLQKKIIRESISEIREAIKNIVSLPKAV